MPSKILLGVVTRIPCVPIEVKQHGLIGMLLFEVAEEFAIPRLTPQALFIQALADNPLQPIELRVPTLVCGIPPRVIRLFAVAKEEDPRVLVPLNTQLSRTLGLKRCGSRQGKQRAQDAHNNGSAGCVDPLSPGGPSYERAIGV